MATFSLCMIVKNEERVLARCLDSISDLMDEIIIVDTGSTDSTKEIAYRYTKQVYDFEWCDDFSAARNFAFSKATCEYIYSADADEVLDAKNHRRLSDLKRIIYPEIEIVQMHYITQEKYNTTQNYLDEYRPKLYKRIRTFTWINPVHETVRTLPVVFDSDVEILHLPESMHSKRDFSIFEKNVDQFSPSLFCMYAKELFFSGEKEDFIHAIPIVIAVLQKDFANEIKQEAACILAHAYRLNGADEDFLQISELAVQKYICSEICYELAEFYRSKSKLTEAKKWYTAALEQTEPCIDICCATTLPLSALNEMS